MGTELEAAEASKLRNPLRFRMRHALKAQLESALHRMGCPHVAET
jgi:hypothetical protein